MRTKTSQSSESKSPLALSDPVSSSSSSSSPSSAPASAAPKRPALSVLSSRSSLAALPDPFFIAAGCYFPGIDRLVGQPFAVMCRKDLFLQTIENLDELPDLRGLKKQVTASILKFPWKEYDAQSEMDQGNVNDDLILYAGCCLILGND